MALQDQPFKNRKKWRPAYKEWRMIRHSLIKNNQPKTEIPTADYKAGGKSVKLPLIYWLFTIFLNFGYVHVISSQQWFKQMYILKIILIIPQSSSWFVKCMAVNVWYYIKEINFIFVSVITYLVADNVIITSTWKRRIKYGI